MNCNGCIPVCSKTVNRTAERGLARTFDVFKDETSSVITKPRKRMKIIYPRESDTFSTLSTNSSTREIANRARNAIIDTLMSDDNESKSVSEINTIRGLFDELDYILRSNMN